MNTKRKLKISVVKPPERLIKINPTAMPEESKTATAASPEISNFCRIFVMTSALANDTRYAVHNGYTPIKSPLWTAYLVSLASALVITKIRQKFDISGEAAVAVLLSSGIGVGLILISLS